MFLVNAIIIFITLLNIILYYLRQHQEDEEEEYGERSNGSPLSSDRLCRRFSLAEIKLATQNFNEALVVGKGGFGKVYKGIIDDGASTVAIKRLDSGSKQGAPEFWTEIQMLSKFRHSHLVSLIGYCNHQREMIIVYQYMPGGTLEANLHKIRRSDGDNVSSLSWEQRLKICIGAARGLNYLHTGTSIQHRVIHRDVKSSNILLDENWEAKISDFGLSRIGLTDQPNTHVTTHVKGTFGYIDPEYFLTRRLTRKSDVYAFGVVLFEALCGRPAVDTRLAEEQWGLAFWAKHCIKEGRLLEFVDPSLRGSISSNCLLVFAEIAGQCLQNSSKRRPTMSEVVTRLEYALALQEGTNSAAEDVDIISDTDGHEHLEDADSYTETEASNAGHNNEQIVRITQLGAGTSRSQSDNKPARTMTFVNKVRLFFSARAPVVSDELSDLCTGLGKRFPLRELQVATDNFGNKNLVGRGGFGDVYKGRLANGSLVAIKRYKYERTLSRKLEFLKNVEIIGLALHRNLLQLLGFCMTPTEWLLVYPFMDNGSVASHLWERSESQSSLSWRRRKQVALGAARGLAYLHDDCISTIIHGNVKAANILLDNEFEVVIGDFGLTKVMHHNDTPVSTTVVRGTIGQIAPEYLSTGKCSQKTDVFGYGVMLLELITRQRAYDLARLANDDDVMLLDWVSGLVKKKRLETVIDEGLQGDYVFEDVEQLLQLALLCTQISPTKRPTMSEVVRMLQGDGLAERWEVWLNDDNAVHNNPYFNNEFSLADSWEFTSSEELSSPR